jgi:hypothetical protein
MSNGEMNDILKKLKAFKKEAKGSPDKVRAMLIAAGILDKNGNITKEYKAA